jgi:hypothetical protein
MEKYIKNMALRVMMLLVIAGIVVNPVQAVTILNSVSAQSSTGGQVVTNGTPGQDGTPGKNGQDGTSGKNGADGVSGNQLVTKDSITETSVVSIVDGEAITSSYQNSQDPATETNTALLITNQDTSDGLPDQIGFGEEVEVNTVTTLTPYQSTQIEAFIISLRNLFTSYVNAVFNY